MREEGELLELDGLAKSVREKQNTATGASHLMKQILSILITAS
jgi:hypothetical protein